MRNSIIVFFIVILISSTQIVSDSQNKVSAVTFSPNTIPTQPNTTFTNVHVDANPVPHKPFRITATMHTVSGGANLLATLTVPLGVSLTSPLVVNLSPNSYGADRTASWTVVAGSAGVYPITITVFTDNPNENASFPINVVIGSPTSLDVTGINVPGNIFQNNNFTVGLTLKNTAVVPDNDIIAQILVPAGLQLLNDESSTSVSSIDPNQEVKLNWKLKAINPGSYTISINYSSANTGSNVRTMTINVGSSIAPSGGLLSVVAHSTTILPNSITSIPFDISNNGIQPIYNIQIISATGGGYISANTPMWVGNLDLHDIKHVVLREYTNSALLPELPVTVKYDSGGRNYTETYQAELPLGNQPVLKISTVTVTPSLSYAGDQVDKIDIQIFNYGLGANDVYATLNLPPGLSPAWGNATSAYFGRIDPFQIVTASFFVNVDSKVLSGNYPLLLLITNGNEVTKLNVNFIVSPKAQFQLISVDDSQLYPGGTNLPFKMTIKNTGTATAQTLLTKLLGGNAVPGVKSSYITSVGNREDIGNILPGQSFTTTFLVNLESSFAAGDQATSLEIDWFQNSTIQSNGFVQTLTVPYHVAQGPSYLLYYDAIPWLYVIIAVAFAVGLSIFIKMRRKRIQTMELAALQERAVRRGEFFAPTEFEPLQDLSQEIPDDDNLKTKEKVLPKSSGKSIGKDEDMS
jgi:hypothetical protein